MGCREGRTFPRSLPSVLRLLMMSSSVVLPAPDGPITAHMSPLYIVPVTCEAAAAVNVSVPPAKQKDILRFIKRV